MHHHQANFTSKPYVSQYLPRTKSLLIASHAARPSFGVLSSCSKCLGTCYQPNVSWTKGGLNSREAGSHHEDTFTHHFRGSLRSKWIETGGRYFLQVDRHDGFNDNGHSPDRARFSQGTIKALKHTNFDDFMNKLKIHQYPGKEAMTVDFESAILFEIVCTLDKFPRRTLVDCTATLVGNKDQMPLLLSTLFTELAIHAFHYFSSVRSVESYIGALKMYTP